MIRVMRRLRERERERETTPGDDFKGQMKWFDKAAVSVN
jgi:hypothetical protein